MLCVFTDLAKADLEEIADYIACDNPKRAISFVEEIVGKCQNITIFPRSSRVQSEFSHNLRILTYKRYAICYTCDDEFVRIERIIAGERNIIDLLTKDVID